MRAQLLDRSERREVIDIVRHLLAMQAQDIAAFPLFSTEATDRARFLGLEGRLVIG